MQEKLENESRWEFSLEKQLNFAKIAFNFPY